MVNNQALKFLLPLIGDKYYPNFFMRDELIGIFIGDSDRPEFDGQLLLAYKYPMTLQWAEFEAKLKSIPEYAGDYDYGDDKYVIYRFSLDDYEEDYSHFVNGEYSHISPDIKLKIIKFWNTHSGSNLPEKILNADTELLGNWKRWNKDRKDYCNEGEMWYKPELKNEIFNKNNKY